MILGRDILTESGSNIKFSEHIIKDDYGPFKGYTTPMVDLGAYEFKDLNTEKVTPEELFNDAYVEKVYES